MPGGAQNYQSPVVRPPGGKGGMPRRAAIVAAIIGAGLAVFNQRAALFGPETFDWLSMALSFVSPFLVVIVSQVLGIRAFNREKGGAGARRLGSFLETLVGHGIALRALVTALIVGTVLTAIMVVLAGLDGGLMSPVPAVQIAQVYTLPLIFGAVSQALSYRRARARALLRPGRASGRV